MLSFRNLDSIRRKTKFSLLAMSQFCWLVPKRSFYIVQAVQKATAQSILKVRCIAILLEHSAYVLVKLCGFCAVMSDCLFSISRVELV